VKRWVPVGLPEWRATYETDLFFSRLQAIPRTRRGRGMPGYDQLVYGIKMMAPDRHPICLYYNNVNKRPTIESAVAYIVMTRGQIVDIYLQFFSTDQSSLAPALHLT
jgi:hypothetical protein